ncbi:MAG: hypothetical protein EOS17_16740 [Mesorhizobium sp.]|nr:MAG: hypothetical protein EOS17_16740 [Mesorhizobium sp.]
MTAPSDDLNDLQSDIRQVETLICVMHDVAIETPMPSDEGIAKAMQQVHDLLWIARDLAGNLVKAASACHEKVMADGRSRKAVRS